MPRAIWSGAIAFGLVNVPVKLYSATTPKDVRFHQFEEGTGKRIDHRRFAEGTEREVAYEDIVKGYELDDGRYVMITPEELDAVEPRKSRRIEIEGFVALPEIDPRYFEKSYYVAPAEGDPKAYVLLRETLARTERVAIGRFVMRTKEYLVTIRPSDDVLVLETMFFADEIRPREDLDVPGSVELSSREFRIAEQLVDSLTVEFDPETYEDTYRERVLDLIHQKARGETITVERPEEPAPVLDLMAALEASLDRGRSDGDCRARSERGGGTLRRGGARFAQLSKEELYERAQDAGIPGRSKMTRGELIEALREAS